MDLLKYFTFSMIISILGIRGILLNRRNIPIMSMSIELMLFCFKSVFRAFLQLPGYLFPAQRPQLNMLLLLLSTRIRALKQAFCRTITKSLLSALTNPPVIANNCAPYSLTVWYGHFCLMSGSPDLVHEKFLFALLLPPSILVHWKSQAREVSLEVEGRVRPRGLNYLRSRKDDIVWLSMYAR